MVLKVSLVTCGYVSTGHKAHFTMHSLLNHRHRDIRHCTTTEEKREETRFGNTGTGGMGSVGWGR